MVDYQEKEVNYKKKKKVKKHVVVQCRFLNTKKDIVLPWIDKWGTWRRYESIELAEQAMKDLKTSHRDCEFRIKPTSLEQE